MSHADVMSCVSAVVPCAHMAWPKGRAPALPWAVFYADSGEPLGDDGAFGSVTSWVVELYQRSRDAALERSLEAALRASFGPFRRGESWVSDVDCLMTAYYFDEFDEFEEVDQ